MQSRRGTPASAELFLYWSARKQHNEEDERQVPIHPFGLRWRSRSAYQYGQEVRYAYENRKRQQYDGPPLDAKGVIYRSPEHPPYPSQLMLSVHQEYGCDERAESLWKAEIGSYGIREYASPSESVGNAEQP